MLSQKRAINHQKATLVEFDDLWDIAFCHLVSVDLFQLLQRITIQDYLSAKNEKNAVSLPLEKNYREIKELISLLMRTR